MRKTIFRLLVLIFVVALTACNSDDKIEGYKSPEILVVKLDIEDDFPIEKINDDDGNQTCMLQNPIPEQFYLH